MNNKSISKYFDYAASTPIDEEVKQTLLENLDYYQNASAAYSAGRKVKQIIDESRKNCAYFLQSNSEEIVFTSGSTESNNLAIMGSVSAKKKGRIISTPAEHSSISNVLDKLKVDGFDVVMAEVDKTGKVDLTSLTKLINEETILVTISYANSEIGTIQPINKISQIIKSFNYSRQSDIVFHTDASAAAIVLPCDVSRLGVDLLTLSSSKLYGPKGVGLLYVKRGVSLGPILYGGSQENSLRPGTESAYLTCALAKTLELVRENRKRDFMHFKTLHDIFVNILIDKNIEYIYNGHRKDRLFNIINLSFPGNNGEDLVARLDAEGYDVATGAACEASNDLPSKSLTSIGLTDEEAQSSLRISIGRKTQKEDLKSLIFAIFDIIQK